MTRLRFHPATMTRFILPALSALVLSACVINPYGPGYRPYDDPTVTTDVPPPASQVEVVPILPFVGAIWLSGYWGWSGRGYHWVPGYWAHPRAGYVWTPRRWEPYGGRWQLRGGWGRR